MKDALKFISEDLQRKVKKEKQPEWINPMLAKLHKEIFSDESWIYERKLDGERVLVFKKGKNVNLMSRNRKNRHNTYPEIVEALKKQTLENFIIDGEIVAFQGRHTSFAELQKRMHLKNSVEILNHKTKVFFYAFDIIHMEDHNVSGLPQIERKKLLEKVIGFKDPIRYSQHRLKDGAAFYKEACAEEWEGLIAKKMDSSYTFGRSANWLKLKCINQQELVIGGFTKPAGKRVGFGALLLGYYENGKLQYAGKVGTGFTDEMLRDLYTRMSDLEIPKSPFETPGEVKSKNVHWIKPRLVAEMSFTEWTSSNKLRHPSFLGLRLDKDAKDVIKEM